MFRTFLQNFQPILLFFGKLYMNYDNNRLKTLGEKLNKLVKIGDILFVVQDKLICSVNLFIVLITNQYILLIYFSCSIYYAILFVIFMTNWYIMLFCSSCSINYICLIFAWCSEQGKHIMLICLSCSGQIKFVLSVVFKIKKHVILMCCLSYSD